MYLKNNMFMGQRRPNFCPNSVQFVPPAATMGSHSLFNGSTRAQIGPLWGFWEKVGTTPLGRGIGSVGGAKKSKKEKSLCKKNPTKAFREFVVSWRTTIGRCSSRLCYTQTRWLLLPGGDSP